MPVLVTALCDGFCSPAALGFWQPPLLYPEAASIEENRLPLACSKAVLRRQCAPSTPQTDKHLPAARLGAPKPSSEPSPDLPPFNKPSSQERRGGPKQPPPGGRGAPGGPRNTAVGGVSASRPAPPPTAAGRSTSSTRSGAATPAAAAPARAARPACRSSAIPRPPGPSGAPRRVSVRWWGQWRSPVAEAGLEERRRAPRRAGRAEVRRKVLGREGEAAQSTGAGGSGGAVEAVWRQGHTAQSTALGGAAVPSRRRGGREVRRKVLGFGDWRVPSMPPGGRGDVTDGGVAGPAAPVMLAKFRACAQMNVCGLILARYLDEQAC